MGTITIRPAEPDRDFVQLAAWFSIMEDEPTTDARLKEYYDREKERIIQRVAMEEQGDLLGFHWLVDDRIIKGRASFNLYVRPEKRGLGTGRRLYEDLVASIGKERVGTLLVNVADNDPPSLTFAEHRGFSEQRHRFGMSLDLQYFDDRPYDDVIDQLQGEGFHFTSMEALGNTEECQKKLYILNDTAASSTPGSNGEHPWESFEDFQKRVCQADWYKPDGQIVAIDTTNGNWAAMSAITQMEGTDYAYNLFTGVDMQYRGRRLGQAVKVLALRYARQVLKMSEVRTHHNTRNDPIIAIDKKFGYTVLPGTFIMEKNLR